MIHQPFHCYKDIKGWASYLKKLRAFFDNQGFFEVFTPNLVDYGAFESTIDPLIVSFSKGHAELHTSPEIQMKGLLAQSGLPIYQICKCYRDDPQSLVHAIEFTMLEYYRPQGSYALIQKDIEDLISSLSPKPLSFRTHSVLDYLESLTELDLRRLNTSESLGEAIRSRRTIAISESDTWEDMFFKLLIEKVEPSLDPLIPTFLTNYPATVSPLSFKDPATGLAQRFEIYWHGMELCNGCVELTDLNLLQENYQRESALRKQMGKLPHPIPNLLFESAKQLKKCAGVAVGLERLFLALSR